MQRSRRNGALLERTLPDPFLDPFSQREIEILNLINEGLSNAAIAQQLYLSLETIKWYNKQIFSKLAVNSRTQAIIKAREYGLLDYRAASAKHNLPRQITRFIGREAEVRQVKAMLEKASLVTLTGPGGVGKSRLSIQIAREAAGKYADGTWFVELAPLTNPERLLHTVARSLRLVEDPTRPVEDMLTAYLRPRQGLLVLDNCEHLIDACARLAALLLSDCPRLNLLVSSREALGMAGEAVYSTPGMQIPDSQHLASLEEFRAVEAVQLFEERARDILPSFKIVEEDVPAIADICRRLDGIPLAIELAAARMNVFTTSQLASRLDHAFEVLNSLRPATLPRHQTLRATIEWSYNLLSPEERRLLRCLSVFSGSWRLEAAETICMADGTGVASLVNKSVVEAVRAHRQETRYRLLEMIRQYAWEKLAEAGETELLRDRHLAYFASWAEENSLKLQTHEQRAALSRLKAEHDNMHEALNWALVAANPARAEQGLRLVSALGGYWILTSSFHEGYSWLEKALNVALPDSQSIALLRAKVLYIAGVISFYIPGMNTPVSQDARRLFDESNSVLREFEDSIGESRMMSAIGWMMATKIDARAHPVIDEGIRLARQSGERWSLAANLLTKGAVARNEQDLAKARACLEESLALFDQVGDQWAALEALIILGNVTSLQGDLSAGRVYFKEALRKYLDQVEEINFANSPLLVFSAYLLGEYTHMATLVEINLEKARKKGNDQVTLYYLRLSGIVARVHGAINQAKSYFQENLLIAQNYGDLVGVCLGVSGLAGVALDSGQPELAARLLGAVEALLETLAVTLQGIDSNVFQRDSQAAREQLGDATFAEAWGSGRLLTLEQAIREAGTIIAVDRE